MPRIKLDPGKPPKDRTDWIKIRSKPDREVLEAVRTDPDAKPLTAAQLDRLLPVPNVTALRKRLGMTQAEFSRTYKLSIGTVRDWEQHRFPPKGPARVLLTVIEQDPQAVERALNAKTSLKSGNEKPARSRV